MHCPLGNHLLRGSGEFITNPRHIRFANKFFPDYLPSEKVCAKCKHDIGIAYEFRMKRALAMRARNGSLVSSYSTSSEESVVANSQNNRRNTARNSVQRGTVSPSLASTDEDDGQPTTSAQAAAKRRERDERHKRIQQQRLLPINVQRGARLPHIQPVARRQQFVHLNPDIMDIYLKGTTGG